MPRYSIPGLFRRVLTQLQSQANRIPSGRRVRPMLEELETRLTPSTGADLHPVGAPLAVNASNSARQLVPFIALDAAGDSIVAWQSYSPGGTPSQAPTTRPGSIEVQRFTAQGAAIDPQPIAVTSSGWITGLAADAAGDFAIAWQTGTGQGPDEVQFYSAQGVAQLQDGPLQLPNTGPGFPAAPATLAADSVGHFFIAWQDNSNNAFVQGYNAQGTAQADAVMVSVGNHPITSLSVAADGAGQFVLVAGTGTGSTASPFQGIFGQRYDAQGATLGNQFQVSATGGLGVHVAADGVGHLAAVWSVYNQGVVQSPPAFVRITGQRFDDLGNLAGSAFQVNVNPLPIGASITSPLIVPAIAMDGAGDFEVAYGTVNPQAQGNVIYGQRYDPTGAAVGGLARLSPVVGSDLSTPTATGGFTPAAVALAADAAGDLVLGWISFNGDSGTSSLAIQRFTGAAANLAPQNATAIGAQSAAVRVTSQFDASVGFTDPDGDPLLYSAVQTNTNPLPTWLHLTPAGLFWGTPETADAGQTYQILVGATDPNGASSTQAFALTVQPDASRALGSEFRVNPAGAPGTAPVVTVNNAGVSLVVWSSVANGTSPVLLGQIFNAQHHRVGGPFQINTTTIADARALSVSVAADAAGNFVVVWGDYQFSNVGPTSYAINLRHFSAQGTALSAQIALPTLLNSFTFTGFPRIAVDAAGNLVVTWVDGNVVAGTNPPVLTGTNSYVEIFTPQGTPVTGPTDLGSSTDQPDVAAGPYFSDLVVWHATSGLIYGERFDAGGNSLGGIFQISPPSAASQNAPRVAVDGQGNYVVVWEADDSYGAGIYARRYDASGNAIGSTFRVNGLTIDDQTAPVVAADAVGNFAVLWQSRNQDGNGLGIFGQSFTPSGTADAGLFQANTFASGDQAAPAVAFDPLGNLLATWQSANQDGSGNPGIYAKFFVGNVTLTTATLPTNWAVNSPGYQQTLRATGGVGAVTFTVTSGSLPPGLSLDPGGVLSGTPNTVGDFPFTVTAKDTQNQTSSRSYDILVKPILPPAFAYDPNTMILTITATNFTFGQTTSADASGVHTNYAFTADGNTLTFADTALTKVNVNGAGTSASATLYTIDNYVGTDGQTHTVPDIVALWQGGGELLKFNTPSNVFVFLQMNNINTTAAYLGRSDLGELYATPGETSALTTNGLYSTMNSAHQSHFIWGAPTVYGYAENAGDYAVHNDGSGASSFVVSGVATSTMSGTDQGLSFFNQGIGFHYNSATVHHAGDIATFYDSPANDVFVGGTSMSYLYSTNSAGNLTEFDSATGFAQVFAYSFVGGLDTAFNNDQSHNTVVGFGVKRP